MISNVNNPEKATVPQILGSQVLFLTFAGLLGVGQGLLQDKVDQFFAKLAPPNTEMTVPAKEPKQNQERPKPAMPNLDSWHK